MKKVSKIVAVMLCMTAMAMTSCKSDDEPEVPVNTSGIPSDDLHRKIHPSAVLLPQSPTCSTPWSQTAMTQSSV